MSFGELLGKTRGKLLKSGSEILLSEILKLRILNIIFF